MAAHQAPPFLGFSRQEHWSGLPCPLPGDLPDPGIEPMSLSSPALSGGFFTIVSLVKPLGWLGGQLMTGQRFVTEKSPVFAKGLCVVVEVCH